MGDVRELNSLGLIEMRQTGDLAGDLRVTAAGYSHLAELDRRERAMSAAAPAGAALAMDWESEVSEVLAAVYTAWSEAADEDGVTQAAINARLEREANDRRTALILRSLSKRATFARQSTLRRASGLLSANRSAGRSKSLRGGRRRTARPRSRSFFPSLTFGSRTPKAQRRARS